MNVKNYLSLFCLTATAVMATSTAQADYTDVLGHQRELSLEVPFADQSFWGTHNSYNTSSWSFSLPNQSTSVQDQLKRGAQFFEFDVHQYSSNVYLCHGECFWTGRKKLWAALNEQVKPFLENTAYENQVLILYIEDKGGDDGKVRQDLVDYIGDYIYYASNSSSGACSNIPDTLTPQDVLDAGKRVVIWKDSGCSTDSIFATMHFTGLGNVNRQFEQKPTGCTSCKDYTPAQIAAGLESGQNFYALDFIGTAGVDIPAVAWSWNVNAGEPLASSSKLCALQTSTVNSNYTGGSWITADCSEQHEVACYVNGAWVVPTGQTSDFAGAATLCAGQTTAANFSVPTSAYENKLLQTYKTNSGSASNVWINIHDSNYNRVWKGAHKYNNYTASADTSVYNAYSSIARSSSKCIDANGGTSNGSNVHMWSCDSSNNNQKWTMNSDGTIKSILGKCLDVSGGGTSNGTNIQLWDCNAANANQVFTTNANGTISWNAQSNMCIDSSNSSNGGNVKIWSCDSNNANQLWTVTEL